MQSHILPTKSSLYNYLISYDRDDFFEGLKFDGRFNRTFISRFFDFVTEKTNKSFVTYFNYNIYVCKAVREYV